MSPTLPGPAYFIRTRRLVIRCWNPADAPLLKAAIEQSLDHLQPWMPWAHQEPQELQQKVELLRQFRGKFDLGHDFVYGIFNREESQVLGGTGLHSRVGDGAREIGYWIHQAHINQGLATEVSAALTKVAFEIEQVKRVEIHCDLRNVRSAAVPKKLGFTHEDTLLRQFTAIEGERVDIMIWTLQRAEYASGPAASAEIEAFDAMGRKILGA
jgi:RimJ/RimL family protein N-acetyltransferase